MHRLNKMAFTNVSQITVDIVCILFAYSLSSLMASTIESTSGFLSFAGVFFLFGLIYLLVMSIDGMYDRSHFKYYDRTIKNVVFSCFISSMAIVFLLPALSDSAFMRWYLGLFILLATLTLTVQWIISTAILVRKHNNRKNKSMLVGSYENIEEYLKYIGKTRFTIEPIGYIANSRQDDPKDPIVIDQGGRGSDAGARNGHSATYSIPCLGIIDDLEQIISNSVIDEVIFAMPHTFVGRVEHYMELCEERGLTVKVALDFENMSFSKSCINSVGPLPVITYHTVSLNEFQNMLKRIMDIMGALVGLVLTLVLSLFIVPAILLDSPGPVLFKQKRMGKNGRTFMMYKFRSMSSDAEEKKEQLQSMNQVKDGLMFKIKDDPRVTKVGEFLRKTSLDELPQFINILFGDMSLVGTRPPTMDEVALYENSHYRRMSIKPGLTGMWQVSGRSSITDFNEVVRLDMHYIDNWSIWHDFSIIFRTVLMMVSRRQHAF